MIMNNSRDEYEKKYGLMWAAMESVSEDEYNRLVELCQKNCWIKWHGLSFMDDPFLENDSPYTFCRFEDITMLKLFFEHGNWNIRQGGLYKELFFCNQVNGGDEWWTCRYDHKMESYFPFESVSFRMTIKEGAFEMFLNDMLAATVEECKRLEYVGKSTERKGENI